MRRKIKLYLSYGTLMILLQEQDMAVVSLYVGRHRLSLAETSHTQSNQVMSILQNQFLSAIRGSEHAC